VIGWISVAGIGIDVFGVLVILLGIAWATLHFCDPGSGKRTLPAYARPVGDHPDFPELDACPSKSKGAGLAARAQF
jgi:hypothetical protein